MPNHKDIKKYTDYWGFLNKMADAHEKGEWDHTASQALADWLEEKGDRSRSLLFKHAAGGFGVDQFGDPHLPHPDKSDGPLDGNWLSLPVNGSSNPNAYRPLDALSDNAHTGTQAEYYYRRDTGARLPAARTTIHIPRTVSSTGKSRTLVMKTHFPRVVFHEFARSLKGKPGVEWRTAAERMFPMTEKPTKLAAIEAPNSTQPTVTVKVPVPVPAAQKPAAPTPEQAKPKTAATGPAFIFPG